MGNQLSLVISYGYWQSLSDTVFQFRPYAGKYTEPDIYHDIGLGVGGTVVAHLLKCIPSKQTMVPFAMW